MLITFEPKVAQRSVASKKDHTNQACHPEATIATLTMYRRLYKGTCFFQLCKLFRKRRKLGGGFVVQMSSGDSIAVEVFV